MELLTIDQVSDWFQIKRSTIYIWAYRKQIPSQKVGGALRFERQTLERWLEAQKRAITQED